MPAMVVLNIRGTNMCKIQSMILIHSDFIAGKPRCEINLASTNRRTHIMKTFLCKVIEFKLNNEGNEKGEHIIYCPNQALVRTREGSKNSQRG